MTGVVPLHGWVDVHQLRSSLLVFFCSLGQLLHTMTHLWQQPWCPWKIRSALQV